MTGPTRSVLQLQTYDVDSHTGYPTPEGQPLLLPPSDSTSKNLIYASVTPAPGDHFVYIMGETDGLDRFIWVYPTDSFGVPQGSPIQTVTTTDTWGFEIDPNGKLAYTIEGAFLGTPSVSIRVFTVDPRTGLLSKTSRIVQAWGAYGPCGNGDLALPFLVGFNPEGSELYEAWSCTFYQGEDYGAYYYSSAVDPRSGRLGRANEIFGWIDSGGSGDLIFLTARFMVDFYENGGYGFNSVNVYPVYPLTGAPMPLISCTVTMLPACGDALNLYADPASEYVFLQLPTNIVQIAKIELATKTIVDTGNYLAEPLVTMSPDRLLIYTQSPGQLEPHILWIYVFDPQTGTAHRGGEFPVKGGYYQLVPAIRE